MRKGTLAALAALAVVTIVALAVLAGGDSDDDTPGHARPESLHAALCETRHAAARGDVAEARLLFANQAHAALHDLAAAAAEKDRPAAARVLEAKEAVEDHLAQASPELVHHLDRLIAEAARARNGAAPARSANCEQREES